jgi:hypothetical protein
MHDDDPQMDTQKKFGTVDKWILHINKLHEREPGRLNVVVPSADSAEKKETKKSRKPSGMDRSKKKKPKQSFFGTLREENRLNGRLPPPARRPSALPSSSTPSSGSDDDATVRAASPDSLSGSDAGTIRPSKKDRKAEKTPNWVTQG